MRSVGSMVGLLVLEIVEPRARRLLGARVASQVRGAQARLERTFDSRFYSRRLAFQTQAMTQHKRGGEEHRQRVGDPPSGDVRRRAVHGLEQSSARPTSLPLPIGGGG